MYIYSVIDYVLKLVSFRSLACSCCRCIKMSVLTTRRILQDTAIIIGTGNHLELGSGHSFTHRIACNHFNFTGIVLASLWNIQMEHAIVGQLVTRALHGKTELSKTACRHLLPNLHAPQCVH